MNLRYTDTTALRTMTYVLDILRANNEFLLKTCSAFNTMSDDDFDMFLGTCAATIIDLNIDLDNTRLVEYVVRSEIDSYNFSHNVEPFNIVVDGTDRNTGEVLRTNTLCIGWHNEDRLCRLMRRLLLAYRSNDYDIHVRIEHN
jgi:hypothetical protein